MAADTQTGTGDRDHLAGHLLGIARDLQSRVSRSLAERGYEGLRPSVGPFLTLIWEEGRPLTAIADELGISKQACSQLANHVEDAGYLERRPHPEDRRAKLVKLTARGRQLVEDAVGLILETESQYAALVGARAYRRFTDALAELYLGLGLPTHEDPALIARASRSVGVLPLVADWIQHALMDATIARGHAGLKMSFGQVLPFVGPDGARIHEIARLQRVSRQAISAISRELETLGYLERRADPRDRRGVVLALTRRGEALIGDSVSAVEELEDGFRDLLGGRFAHLERVSRDLADALGHDDESEERGASRDIEELATRLRRQLGSGDAGRLAALLEPSAGKGGA